MAKFDDAPRYDAATQARFRELGYWTDDSLDDVLAKWSATEPDRVAIIHGAERMTYGELHGAARRFANGLIGLGLGKGDVVAIQMPNLPEFLIAYLGVALMGGVLSPLHMPYRAGCGRGRTVTRAESAAPTACPPTWETHPVGNRTVR